MFVCRLLSFPLYCCMLFGYWTWINKCLHMFSWVFLKPAIKNYSTQSLKVVELTKWFKDAGLPFHDLWKEESRLVIAQRSPNTKHTHTSWENWWTPVQLWWHFFCDWIPKNSKEIVTSCEHYLEVPVTTITEHQKSVERVRVIYPQNKDDKIARQKQKD